MFALNVMTSSDSGPKNKSVRGNALCKRNEHAKQKPTDFSPSDDDKKQSRIRTKKTLGGGETTVHHLKFELKKHGYCCEAMSHKNENNSYTKCRMRVTGAGELETVGLSQPLFTVTKCSGCPKRKAWWDQNKTCPPAMSTFMTSSWLMTRGGEPKTWWSLVSGMPSVCAMLIACSSFILNKN